MSPIAPLVLVEPSAAPRRKDIARLRALSAPGDFDCEAIKKRLSRLRERSVGESGWLVEDFTRSAKSRGLRVLVARDETAAARHVMRSARGHGHLLFNKSATVRQLAPFLEKEGFTLVDTYAAEEQGAAPAADLWRQWQLGEPEPHTLWESFDAQPPQSFRGSPLPVPDGRWAAVVGLSAASARDAGLYFVQHTHNVSKLLYSADKLFVVAGIEKLVPRAEDALFQARCSALFGLPAVLEDALKDEGSRGTGEQGSGGAGEQGSGGRELHPGGDDEVLFQPRVPPEIHVILLDAGRRRLLRSRNKRILECIGCKACRRGCMMGNLGSASPRDAALYGLASSPSETERRGLYECTMCESCKSACPLEIPSSEFNLALRRTLAKKGKMPDVFRLQSKGILERGNPLGEAPQGRAQFYPGMAEGRLMRGAHLGKGAPVLLYLGCVSSFQRQRIVGSAFRLMAATGTEFTVLGEAERCCGYPLYVAGSDDFEEAARRNIASIKKSGARTVVTTCAGCNKTLRKVYAERFELDFEALHMVEFLSRQINGGRLRFQTPVEMNVAYHDPCDLGRAMGVYEPPRELLAAVPGLEPLEFHFNRQSSRCCGAGGGAKGYDSRLSEEHALGRMKEAVDAGADVVTSACPACLANLQIVIPRVKRDTGKALRFMDLSEIAARALGPG